jgi:hypothetical protein
MYIINCCIAVTNVVSRHAFTCELDAVTRCMWSRWRRCRTVNCPSMSSEALWKPITVPHCGSHTVITIKHQRVYRYMTVTQIPASYCPKTNWLPTNSTPRMHWWPIPICCRLIDDVSRPHILIPRIVSVDQFYLDRSSNRISALWVLRISRTEECHWISPNIIWCHPPNHSYQTCFTG